MTTQQRVQKKNAIRFWRDLTDDGSIGGFALWKNERRLAASPGFPCWLRPPFAIGKPVQIRGRSYVLRLGQWSGGAVTILSPAQSKSAPSLDEQTIHSARLATLGEMAACIAHEFNQCLHVIRLAAESLSLEVEEERATPARIRRRSDTILGQVGRLTDMVRHMRAISRRDDDNLHNFSPRDAIISAVAITRPLLESRAIHLDVEDELGDALVLGHRLRLEQVLLNVLNNARDAICDTPRHTEDGHITIHGQIDRQARRLLITITDNGPGIPQHLRPHLFTPFVTSKQGSRGSGLGLSISRDICLTMGGRLYFQDQALTGASFVIELPLAQGETAPPLSAQGTPAPSLADPADLNAHDKTDDSDDDGVALPSILLVDDDPLTLTALTQALAWPDLVVDTAHDGTEALEKCRRTVYDAVITDLRMPDLDGLGLARELDDLQPGTAVIVITGQDRAEIPSWLRLRAAAIFSKPVHLHELGAFIRHLLPSAPGTSPLRTPCVPSTHFADEKEGH